MTRRVLIARLDSVGDVVLCGPAVRAVAASPDVDEVVMLCGSRGADAARLLPGVDRVLEWDCPWIASDAPAPSRYHLSQLRAMLASAVPDAAIVLTSFHQSPLPLALELRLAGVPFIAAASVDFAGGLLDVRLRPGEDFPEDQPEPLRALRIAEAAGFTLPPDDDGRLRLRIQTPPPASIAALRHPVVVHPGASASARRWPADAHREAVRMLQAEGRDVVVTGGPAETALTAFVSGRGRAAIDLGGMTRLDDLAAVIGCAEVVVAGNTGPAHVAAALDVPVVSLFAPVVPAVRWAPYGAPHIVLGDQFAACRNSRATVCPVPGHPCLSSVSPAQVVEACDILAPLASAEEVRA